MLLQTPWSRVQELDELDPERKFAVPVLAPPAGLKQIATRKQLGPTCTKEECNDNDEGALNSDQRRFEL